LHGDEVAPLVLADVIGLHDVGVRQARRHARLLEEHGQELAVVGEIGTQLLERHELGKAGRTVRRGDIDDAQATTGYLADETVAPDVVAERMYLSGHQHLVPDNAFPGPT